MNPVRCPSDAVAPAMDTWVPLDPSTPAPVPPHGVSWTPAGDTPAREAPPRAAPPPTSAPLQALGQVHRALRDNEKRLTSLSDEIGQASLRTQQDGEKLRAECDVRLAELEELQFIDLTRNSMHREQVIAVNEGLPNCEVTFEAERAKKVGLVALKYAMAGAIQALVAPEIEF